MPNLCVIDIGGIDYNDWFHAFIVNNDIPLNVNCYVFEAMSYIQVSSVIGLATNTPIISENNFYGIFLLVVMFTFMFCTREVVLGCAVRLVDIRSARVLIG